MWVVTELEIGYIGNWLPASDELGLNPRVPIGRVV